VRTNAISPHAAPSLQGFHILRNTTQLVQTAIHAGASYIGVHGRTRHQKDTEPANWEGIKFAREEAKGEVPVVGNGDIFTLQDSLRMKEETGVNAAMSARGLLENPVSIVQSSVYTLQV
jgi:tRNA-dihydrouridine synthase 4